MEFMDKNNKARAKEIDAALNNVVDDFDKFEHYFLSHWKEFVYASAGILVAVAIIGFIYMLYLNSDKKAIDTLASARTIEELQSALAEYGSHASAATARTRLAHLLFEQRQYDAAVVEFDAVIAATDGIVQAKNQLDKAYCLETAGKLAEAAETFLTIATLNSAPENSRLEAAYGAGRLYFQLNQPEQAADVIQLYVNTGADSNMYATGAFWLEQLRFLSNQLPPQAE